ncbi:MAG: hypothetical protein A2504_15190 [Bdellovibrionales bacterium RIFOXYD12_FULL_39_22]|nr:MAG: hypothetical protein A2385_02620 [Bdellovibrionales bacterium RIFOXYB1_FULL_39_21]OFZ43140.1 MAG: hypothetical protein A2485_11765 [Bdellovibrionales bacterium RIFOXYC12_FULL_39_17]OFZ47878.1 MAG: hypothetical protein A2404_16405 [Bdellovibrionales bacterium RIFOXYC1_FULL_39_130]OFZ69960.1 MAG: hypothetical protein A2451_07845 [Bdellovibrionales bacterium RIFOXYC2_FULL_39_8]OFZ75658.1 MAG: hypothetical protein A2560_12905 [Bdellovibrionales bacterium RIFOXYD1_FULL_39_84]OFZ94148.1 MAG:
MFTTMIIDDSLTSRMYIKKCLSMLLDGELKFIEAENGEEALRKMEEQDIDLIISDVSMPVMTGFTFLRNIKSNANFEDVPVIFVTSLANEGRAENLMALGAAAVIKKPVEPSSLRVVLSKLYDSQEGKTDDGNGGAWE